MKKVQSRQGFLRGAAILTAAAVAVKLIGACFKIPLTNLLGGVGMGDFTIAYDIFRPLSALALAGLPVAVSKLVSENAALGRWRDVRRLLRLSGVLFCLTGMAAFAVMLLGAEHFAAALGSPGSAPAIAALSPAVFFCCLMSIYRGYYQGLGNMVPTAVSQVVEALVKLVCGIGLCVLFIRTRGGTSTGAVGAVLGVAASTAAGGLFLLARHLLCGDGISRERLAGAPEPFSRSETLCRMARVALPVCLASVVSHLTGMIDLTSILTRLDVALQKDASAMLAGYAGMLPEDIAQGEIAKYLYGSYSGIALNIFNLLPSLTAAIGVSVLPALSGAWAVRDRKKVERSVGTMLRATMLLACPAGMGLTALAGPICNLLYGRKPMEAALASEMLRLLGIAAILVSMTAPLNAALQAVGEIFAPCRLMLLGGAVKYAVNHVLIAIPEINLAGAPVGTLLCYAVIVPMSMRLLTGTTGVRVDVKKTIVKPAAAGAMCAAAAWSAQGLLARVIPEGAATLCAVGIGVLVYAAAVLLTRTITRDDVRMLPCGEKIAKILEKHAMMG